MGNQLTFSTICMDNILANKQNKSPKDKKWLRLKSRNIDTNTNNKYNQNDDFIIKYNKTNLINNNKINIKSLDQRRVIFVSLIGLHHSWRECPSFVLYSAIFLLKLKREWVYNPAQYVNEIKAHFVSQLNSFSDISETREFIKLLKWKDSQGLVFWMLNDYDYNLNTNGSLVNPFWHYFNKQLTSLYDPISKNKYNEVDLNEKHWHDKISSKNKYCTKTVSIFSELYFLNAKFKPIQEIIYQSNPNSLLPITSYCNRENTFCQLSELKLKATKVDLCQEFDIDSNGEDWWISDNYDPYQL